MYRVHYLCYTKINMPTKELQISKLAKYATKNFVYNIRVWEGGGYEKNFSLAQNARGVSKKIKKIAFTPEPRL